MVRPRHPARLAALPLVVAALAGCGGDEPVEARGNRVALALDDFSVVPQAVIARPGELTIDLTNRGRLAHNLKVIRRGQTVRRSETLHPGRSTRVELRTRRGSYRLVCSIGNHEELGQYGILTVR